MCMCVCLYVYIFTGAQRSWTMVSDTLDLELLTFMSPTAWCLKQGLSPLQQQQTLLTKEPAVAPALHSLFYLPKPAVHIFLLSLLMTNRHLKKIMDPKASPNFPPFHHLYHFCKWQLHFKN